MWATARFYPSLTLLHASAWFGEGYESDSTFLSFWVSCIRVAQAPGAFFHHFQSQQFPSVVGQKWRPTV